MDSGRDELEEHEDALRQAHGFLEEGTVIEGRAATAGRVFEPAANDLCTLDRFAQDRELLFGDVTQLLRCRTISGGRPKQQADLVQAEPGSLRGLDHRECPQDRRRVAAPAADSL